MSVIFSNTGKVTPTSVLKAVRELNPAGNPAYSQKDDITSGKLFSDIFKSIARYNVTSREWNIYDGVRWTLDSGGMYVEQLAKLLARSMYIYSADITDSFYKGFCQKLQKRDKRETMLKDARSFAPISESDLDQHPELFNCQNCIVNLETFETIEHNSDLLLSKVSNVIYNPDSDRATVEKFISEIMCGDASKIDYLQQIFGYGLTGDCPQEELYILYGSTTRNGKSTICDTLEYMCGDYAAHIQPETLAQQDKNSRNASGDIARLKDVRFLHCSEPPKRMKFDIALLKTLTGRDSITARRLYEREFEFIPVFKLFINTNYLPIVADDTFFTSGRVKVVSFDRHFEPEEQDVHLKDTLRKPENISALFNWCLDGLRKYHAAGDLLIVPDAVNAATNAYREQSDKIANFMKECFIQIEGEAISGKDAYLYYQEWCKANGYGTENKSNFFAELRSKGLLFDSGTVAGKTVRNALIGYKYDLDEELPFYP